MSIFLGRTSLLATTVCLTLNLAVHYGFADLI